MQVRVHNPEGRAAPKDGPLGIRRDFSDPEENPCSTCGKGVPPTPTTHMTSRDRHAWALQQVGNPWITNPGPQPGPEPGDAGVRCVEVTQRHDNIPGAVCHEVAPPPSSDPTVPAPPSRFFCCPLPGYFFVQPGPCPEGATMIAGVNTIDGGRAWVCRRHPAADVPLRTAPLPPSPVTAGAMLAGRRAQRAFKQQLAASGAVASPERVRNCNLGALALALNATDPQGYQHLRERYEGNPGEGALLLALRASDPFGYYRQSNPPLVPIGQQLVPWADTRTGPGAGNYSRAMFSPNADAFPMLNNLAPQGPPWVFNPGSAELAYAYQPNPGPSAIRPAGAQVLGVGPMSSVPMGAIHNPTFWPGGPRGNPTRQAYWDSR